ALPHLEVREPQRVLLEAVGELLGPPHRLAEEDAAHRKRFLNEARDVGERLLRRLRDPAALVADAARQEDEQRDEREREERELPAEQDHADHRRDHRRDVRRDRGRRVRDDVLHAADVVRDARLHLAGSSPREEREREALQVAEDLRAQVVHDALADLVRQQRLHDAEDAAGDCDDDHPAGEPRELLVVVADDRLDHALQEEGRDDASVAEKTISPSRPLSRARYGVKSATIRRRFARRTSGSAGRSGASRAEWKYMPTRPGYAAVTFLR